MADEHGYCEHGTYVGGPLGPDYICGACEMDEGAPATEDAFEREDDACCVWGQADES